LTSQTRAVRAISIGLCAVVALVHPVFAQVKLSSDALEIGLGGRLQMQLATSSCSGFAEEDTTSACANDVPSVDMFARRIRLRVDIKVNEWISGRIQPDFGRIDGVRLADAYGRLNLAPDMEHPHARITMGHFKRPFDGFQLTSSSEFVAIERAILIPGLPVASFSALSAGNRLSDRDIGVMVDGSTPNDRFHYWVGVFNGNLAADNRDENSGKQFVGRVRAKLSAGSLPLEVAVGGSVTDAPFERENGQLDGEYFFVGELWAELGDFNSGPHVQAGLLLGKNSLPTITGEVDLEAGDPLPNMVTWQTIGSYKLAMNGNFFLEAIEPLFRVTMADPDTDADDDIAWGLTPGLQLFFDGRNKLAVNWDLALLSGGRDTESAFRAQYQFYF
jgi:hypothetical protein